MAVRIRFDATLETRSELGVFPANIVHTVILSNRDDCTYQIVPVTADGKISVSYDMQSNKDTVRMTDRIKIFFYYQKKRAAGQLLPICAGHMPLLQLAKLIAEGGEHTTACNFSNPEVREQLPGCPRFSNPVPLTAISCIVIYWIGLRTMRSSSLYCPDQLSMHRPSTYCVNISSG